jgi:hypothetical protein
VSEGAEKYQLTHTPKIPGYKFSGKPFRQIFAQGTGISLMPGSDMLIISAIFQGEVITAGFCK